MNTNNSPLRIGIIAGNGQFPFEIIAAARARGYEVYAICLRGEAEERVSAHCTDSAWIGIGELGKLIEHLHSFKVKEVIFAGGVRRRKVFAGLSFDMRALSLLSHLRLRSDDILLRAIAAELEKEGIIVVGAEKVLDSNVPHPALLTTRGLSPLEREDALLGWKVTRQLGALDVGQSAVIYEGVTIALEALEGTDAMIERAGTLCGRGGVLVKTSKPGQDLRMDLPAIGTRTITQMVKASVTALVLEAKHAIVLERDKVIERANQHGIAIVVWDESVQP